MRALAKPEVLKTALTAALLTAILAYPRLSMWGERTNSLGYLEALLFLCTTVLWAFVFAWHTKYTGRPLFNPRPGWLPVVVATVTGIGAAAVWHFHLDATMRGLRPTEYPSTFMQWIAQTLWICAVTQLCLIYAPFSWLMRLLRRIPVAAALTVLLGLLVMWNKNRLSATPIPWGVFTQILAMHLCSGALAIYLLLRGGIPVVWYWALLFQSRHLLALTHS
jgi:hypothetical protein